MSIFKWVGALLFLGALCSPIARSGSPEQQYVSHLQNRQKQLSRYYDAQAAKLAPGHHALSFVRKKIRGSRTFCDDLNLIDTISIWSDLKELMKTKDGKFGNTIPFLFAMLKECDFTPNSARTMASILDYLYWNRQTDLLNFEIADVLMFRTALQESYVIDMGIRKLEKNSKFEEKKEPCPDCMDFLSNKTMIGESAIRGLGKFINFASEEKRKVVEAITEILDMRNGTEVIFGKDLLRALDNVDDLRALHEFHAFLQELQSNRKLLAEPHGGWNRLMKITGNDPEQAIRVLGVLTTMIYWPLNYVGEALARRGQLTAEKTRALIEGGVDYFLTNEMDERAAILSKDKKSFEHHFFYPPGYSTTNWKYYHWFGNAHLGCKLAKRGFSKHLIRYGVRSLAQLYEYATLNLAGPEKDAFNMDPRASAVIEGDEDVQINTDGGDYGAAFCSKK